MQPVKGNVTHTSLVVVGVGMVPIGDVAGSSQPNLSRTFPIVDMELFSDESEEGPYLVSFNYIMDAANRMVEEFEELVVSHVFCP